jgi:hypothetical protein
MACREQKPTSLHGHWRPRRMTDIMMQCSMNPASSGRLRHRSLTGIKAGPVNLATQATEPRSHDSIPRPGAFRPGVPMQ